MSTKEAKHINELKDLIGFKSVIIDLGSYENPELGIDFTLYYYITPNGRVQYYTSYSQNTRVPSKTHKGVLQHTIIRSI